MPLAPGLKVLMVAQPSVGHTTALIGIGARLTQSGVDVRFAVPTLRVPTALMPAVVRTALSISGEITAAGLRGVSLWPSIELMALGLAMPHASGAAEIALAGRMMTSGIEGNVRELERELTREPADVVVCDFAAFAGIFAAERRGLPAVTFFHAGLPFPVDGIFPYTGGEALARLVDQRLKKTRARLGLRPWDAGTFDAPYGDVALLATTPSLEGRELVFGDHVHCVGPCIDGRRERASFPFDALREDHTRVYVSLGTVFNANVDRFRALIGGLAATGVQLIVSAGASTRHLRDLCSDTVLIQERVPQLAILQHVDMVVCHGGNNTVNEALTAGRPLLVVPVGGEQEANARRVERLGAGIALDLATLSAESVSAAFARLRRDPSMGARAAAVADTLIGHEGAALAASLILTAAERRSHEDA